MADNNTAEKKAQQEAVQAVRKTQPQETEVQLIDKLSDLAKEYGRTAAIANMDARLDGNEYIKSGDAAKTARDEMMKTAQKLSNEGLRAAQNKIGNEALDLAQAGKRNEAQELLTSLKKLAELSGARDAEARMRAKAGQNISTGR